MQGFVPCHSSFIHKSHSLLNLFLYILHTRSHIQGLDDQTLPILYRCYLNFLAAALAGLPLIAHSIRKSCLPLGVRCTNKPAIAAPLELETRSKDRGIGNGIRFYIRHCIPGHRQLALNQATRDENSVVPFTTATKLPCVIVKERSKPRRKKNNPIC